MVCVKLMFKRYPDAEVYFCEIDGMWVEPCLPYGSSQRFKSSEVIHIQKSPANQKLLTIKSAQNGSTKLLELGRI